MKLQKEVSFILVQGGGGAIHTKWFHDPHKGFEYFHNHPNWPRTFCGLQIGPNRSCSPLNWPMKLKQKCLNCLKKFPDPSNWSRNFHNPLNLSRNFHGPQNGAKRFKATLPNRPHLSPPDPTPWKSIKDTSFSFHFFAVLCLPSVVITWLF